jgi:hypothetical protein
MHTHSNHIRYDHHRKQHLGKRNFFKIQRGECKFIIIIVIMSERKREKSVSNSPLQEKKKKKKKKNKKQEVTPV